MLFKSNLFKQTKNNNIKLVTTKTFESQNTVNLPAGEFDSKYENARQDQKPYCNV